MYWYHAFAVDSGIKGSIFCVIIIIHLEICFMASNIPIQRTTTNYKSKTTILPCYHVIPYFITTILWLTQRFLLKSYV